MVNKKLNEETIKLMHCRINSLIYLFNKNEFPIQVRILGMPSLHIDSKEECESRVKELCDFLELSYGKRIIKFVGSEVEQEELILNGS